MNTGGWGTHALTERLVQSFRSCCLLLLHLVVYSHIVLEIAAASAFRRVLGNRSRRPRALDAGKSNNKSPQLHIPFPRTVDVVLAQELIEPLLLC